MVTISLTKSELLSVASMINLVSAKDHVEALRRVKFTANPDNTINLVATNRMVIGEQTFTPHTPFTLSNGEPLSVLLSESILKAMKTAKFDGNLIIDETQITLSTLGGSSVTEVIYKGSFPDISEHLPSNIDVESIKPATDFTRLNLDFVTKISKLVSPVDSKNDLPVFRIFTQDQGDSRRPKPVLFERANIRAVIQPLMSK